MAQPHPVAGDPVLHGLAGPFGGYQPPEVFPMSEVLSSLLSAAKPRPQLAKPEGASASRFMLDEAKFLADIYERAAGGASIQSIGSASVSPEEIR
jgi:hypothetical protein